MTIQSAQYTPDGNISAVIDEAQMIVPDDFGNRHRQMIADWELSGNVISPFAPPVATKAAVDVERDRRIVDGFTFEDVFYQTRAEDRENIAGAKSAATDAIALGALPGDFSWRKLLDPNGPETFAWIAADNSIHPMDAQTVVRFGYAALAHKEAHIFAARQIKNLSPIPADYATNASYWP
ncbi:MULTISPECIES: DUF4376 domain-containing protein [unclassified Rhizobium]|uniref:DUF4376 domain-containing protein n=1 Tax=unclassified Rhizobium TaxID=2613769 RepID=UPI001ADA6B20|nr:MULTISPECIES: DUF4376 domain-containing protein [unclassified Rhizobium]MBO9125452.1 DUF4376 domain-containing protein [Rhizobium sp. 16-488-2b]MBO9176037.1 DUF4376 domain-containing protein [Rhizobium sp. 16-488-2a]